MGRDPRYIPANSLQHVTDAVFQHRRLLCPSDLVNRRFLGILGRAQKKYHMEICAVVVMSTHVHYLLRPRDGAHLAAFMCFLKTNIAKEIGKRIHGWHGSFFQHRYHSTTVSDEEIAQVGVLRYILSHGVKENLVDRVEQWPGVHSALPTVEGRPMVGEWIDRTAESLAQSRTSQSDGLGSPVSFASREKVEISPLPCWQHLPESQWRRAVADLVGSIDQTAALRRKDHGTSSLGVEKVLSADPDERPVKPPSSPKPRFHANSPQVLKTMIEGWKEVIQRFREASRQLRLGARHVLFPEGTFPPSLSFIPFSEQTREGQARGRP